MSAKHVLSRLLPLLLLVFTGCVRMRTQGEHPLYPTPDAEGGWPIALREGEMRRHSIDSTGLVRAFEYIQGNTKNGGLLVVHRGILVYERYFGRGHREATPNLASCGKSFTSIAAGILLEERPDLFPDGLDQKVFTPALMPAEAFPPADPRKAEIRLGQLLAFTAGIRGNNPVHVFGEAKTIDPPGPDGWQAMVDSVALGLRDAQEGSRIYSARTLWCEPGGGYSYATSSAHLVSMMLRHVSGVELEEYIRTHLAEPMGWGRWGYGYKNNRAITHTPGGGGIALRPTDMLRFGYLLLREGMWGDRRLVPADYVRKATRQSPYNPHTSYSLQFDVNTGGHWSTVPRDAFWKSGSGGHVLYVVPSLDLVVFKLGGRDDQYSPSNTGLPIHPEAARAVQDRPGWKKIIPDEEARRHTLELVLKSF